MQQRFRRESAVVDVYGHVIDVYGHVIDAAAARFGRAVVDLSNEDPYLEAIYSHKYPIVLAAADAVLAERGAK